MLKQNVKFKKLNNVSIIKSKISLLFLVSAVSIISTETALAQVTNNPFPNASANNTSTASNTTNANTNTNTNTNANANTNTNTASTNQGQPQINYVNPNGNQNTNVAVPTTPPNSLPNDSNNYNGGQKLTQEEILMKLLNTPDKKIREMNKDLINKSKVMNEVVTAAPQSAITQITVHISPGSTPSVIRLFKNRPTTLVVTDSSGAPWPITNFTNGSTEDFEIKRPIQDGNILSITPLGQNISANINLYLKGLDTAVVIDLVSAKKIFDARADLRVDGKGPNTQLSAMGMPDALDNKLLSILQGVAPSDAKVLKVNSGYAQAWLLKDGSMYVRTRFKMLSPAFQNVTSSPDGTYAYKLIAVPVVVLKNQDKFMEIGIDGF